MKYPLALQKNFVDVEKRKDNDEENFLFLFTDIKTSAFLRILKIIFLKIDSKFND